MRRSACLTAIVTYLLLAGAVSAQEGTDWYLNQPIRDIRFEGLVSVPQSDLDPIIRPFIGEPFTERRFAELQRRLFALDYFTDLVAEAVRPTTGTGVIIQFTVEERPSVAEVRFAGNRRVRSGDLLDAVLLKPGDLITLAKRRVDEEAIAALYRERGFPDVRVSSRVETVADRPGASHVIYEVEEGQQVTVREIRFSGNNFVSASTLRGRMGTKAQSIFNSGVFQSRVLEEDRRTIEEYYRERGYVDARVVDVTQEVERDEEQERSVLILTVFIEEGSRYTYGGFSFEGNAIFDDETLDRQIRLRPGAVLNVSRLSEGVQQIRDVYYQDGYIFNAFDVVEDRDEQALSISFTMRIVEQPRAHIENIIIRGNEKTADHVILREIPLRVGDVYSVSRIREGIQALNNLQFFSTVIPEFPEGSVEGLMDLVINVEEAQTADISFGVSFGGSTEFPVAAQVGWTDRNFRGLGQTVGFNSQLSPVEQSLSLTFLERWFAEQRWSLGADVTLNRSVKSGIPQDLLDPVFADGDPNAVPDPFVGYYVFSEDDTLYDSVTYNRGDLFPDPVPSDLTEKEDLIKKHKLITDYEYARRNAAGASVIPPEFLMAYTEWRISTGANTGYRFRTPLGTLALSTSLRASVNYVNYDPAQYRPFDADLRANRAAWQWVNRLGLTAALDQRRGLFLSPSSGYIASQGVAFVGGFLLGDRHYIRTDSKAEAYLTLWDVPVGDSWNWKMVLAAHSDISFVLPTFWVPPRFQDLDQPIAGTDLLSTNMMFIARGWEPVTGGRALWNNWLELRMPIVEQILWFDTYFDAVSLWRDPAEIGSLGVENMLFGFGAGLRFTIPQFPIRLYLGKRFRIDGDGSVLWQKGTLFNGDDTPTGGLDFIFAIGADLF